MILPAALVGGQFLVAPVLELGARSRFVYFPGGAATKWRHYFGDKVVHAGGTNVSVAAPLDSFPLFTRE